MSGHYLVKLEFYCHLIQSMEEKIAESNCYKIKS
ncbi:hypothetical protein SLEP1_g47873 [Rubroshorea leprosula]|uniref:Uncharacterized protein n=1 Tax=Rubroshorea leprosula TaxID=152421 RepID=A0AAV5LRX2_9ROSI|nr:hypothetical protein SLEP1_g47873 [Rubroshorea leprosula]